MEKSRSWPSAHDWKSCIPQKGIEGSNPSFSAKMKTPEVVMTSGVFVIIRLFWVRECWKTVRGTSKHFSFLPLFLPYGISEGIFSLICSLP